jgi:uncharacterized delta-60 repeat protein
MLFFFIFSRQLYELFSSHGEVTYKNPHMKTPGTSLFMACLACSFTANSQYIIDTSFNTNGTNEFTAYAGNIVNGDRLAYTATNDIIVAGRWIDRLSVWKYNQTGDLDASFGSAGMNYIIMPGGTNTWVREVKIQPDGKIVVLAESELVSFPSYAYSQSSIVLARFLSNGMPDPTFGSSGLVNMDLMPAYEYHPLCMSLDAGGNIFVGGTDVQYGSYDCPNGTGEWFIAKYQPDGSLDLTFHTTGFIQSTSNALAQTYATITPMAMVLDVKPLQDGKLLAAGALNAQDSSYFSLRLKPDGTYDSSYALNGINLTFINSFIIPSSELTYANILDDESIIYNTQYVTYGSAGVPDSSDLYVYKKDNLGNTETSFGSGGFLTFHQTSLRTRMTVDNAGRIIYCWYNPLPSGTQRVYFRRLFPNGATETTFGAGGILASEPIPGDTYLNACVMNDIEFNSANDDITLVALRSATYVPNNTFRVLNYHLDTNYHTQVTTINKGEDKFLVYPNPSDGIFTIDVNTNAAFTIFKSTGELISSGKLNAGKNALTTNLPKGLFILHVTEESGKISSRKLMVK